VIRSVSVTAVVPAWNAAESLEACLAALKRLTWQPVETVVFDDGSTDETAAIAKAAGVTVLRNLGPPLGPATGRNRAAALAATDLILFVDSDVVLAPSALEVLINELQQFGAAAAFGSYDDAPHARRASSVYLNLRHHYIHQTGARQASTFWAGIGLVRRDVLEKIGGFDAAGFARPSIEDIDLGARLCAAGYMVRLVPEAQGTHWKDWTVIKVWRTDIFARALPWSKMIADGRAVPTTLNAARIERYRAVAAMLLLLSLIASLVSPGALIAAGAALAAYLSLNKAFFGLLLRRGGARITLVGIAMHWCYHLYASVIFVLVTGATRLGMRSKHHHA
jgi:GT2 family glycosyltransferase